MSYPETSALLQLMVEHTPGAIAIFDRDMRYLITSRQWLIDYSLNDQNIIGCCHYELFPDFADRWKEIHQRCLAGAVEKCDAEPLIGADGTIGWVEWEVRPWWHQPTNFSPENKNPALEFPRCGEIEAGGEDKSRGEIGGIVMVTQNVTQRKQAELALQESEKLLHLAIDNLPQSIFWKDRNFVYQGCNQNFARVAGISKPADIVGKTDYDLAWFQQEAEFFRECDRRVLEMDMIEHHIIEPNLQADGTRLDITKIPLHDGNGNIVGILGTYEELTSCEEDELDLRQYQKRLEDLLSQKTAELEKAHEQLQQEIRDRQALEKELAFQRRLFDDFLKGAPAGIVIIDNELKVVQINQALADMSGLSVQEHLGKTIAEIQPDLAKTLEPMWQQILATGESFLNVEVSGEITASPGVIRHWIESYFPLIGEDGLPFGIGGFIVEISDRKEREKEFALQKALFDAFFSAAPIGLVIMDDALRFVQINEALAEINGQPVAAHIGKNLREIVPEMAPILEPIYQGILTTGEPLLNVEISGERPKEPGILQHWVASYFPLFGKDAFPIGLGAVVIEISDRKRAEEALREQEEFLRSIYDGVDDAIFVLDVLENGEFRYASFNPTAERVLGKKADEMRGRTPEEVFLPPKAAALRQRYTECVRAGTTIYYEHSLNIDQVAHWWLAAITPLHDPSGRIYRLVGTSSNITNRVQAEQALQASEARNRALIAALPDMLFRISSDGTFLDFHAPREDALAMSPSAFLGKKVEEIMPPELAGATMQKVRRAIATGEPQLYEYEMHALDNKVHDYEARYAVSGEGEALVIVRDISDAVAAATQRKQAEIALQKSEAQLREKATVLEVTLRELQQTQAQLIQTEKMSSLGQLVAGVAHEINNPVSFIYGNLIPAREYAEDLLRLIQLFQHQYPNSTPEIQKEIKSIELDFLKEDLPKLLSSMEAGAQRIRDIVLSLRNFSRLDEADMKQVNIHEGIDSTLMILQSRLKVQTKRPEIQVVKAYSQLPPVECYAGQLNQVFMNILSNAIDAMEAVGEFGRDEEAAIPNQKRPIKNPQICISTELGHSNQVVIRIADNGVGMTEEVRSKLFDPFFTTKPVGKGTGLGLSISYQIIVEKHCGSLQCVSSLGSGTEFIIAIPIRQSRYFFMANGQKVIKNKKI